jgi:hypothetical protein
VTKTRQSAPSCWGTTTGAAGGTRSRHRPEAPVVHGRTSLPSRSSPKPVRVPHAARTAASRVPFAGASYSSASRPAVTPSAPPGQGSCVALDDPAVESSGNVATNASTSFATASFTSNHAPGPAYPCPYQPGARSGSPRARDRRRPTISSLRNAPLGINAELGPSASIPALRGTPATVTLALP